MEVSVGGSKDNTASSATPVADSTSAQQPLYKSALANLFKGIANNTPKGNPPATAMPVQQVNLMQPYQTPQAPSTNYGSMMPTSLKGMTRGF
jgi:hypothetical protein